MEERTRRRGATLEQAIHAAALAELGAEGYARLTMDGIAARARTGKAAIYRRWPNKRDLVIDSIRATVPDPREQPLPNDPREALLALLTVMTDVLAGKTGFPATDVLAEAFRDPALAAAFREALIEPRLRAVREILERAAAHAHRPAEVVTPMLVRTAPALVIQTFLMTGRPPTKAERIQIADEIVLPLITGHRG